MSTLGPAVTGSWRRLSLPAAADEKAPFRDFLSMRAVGFATPYAGKRPVPESQNVSRGMAPGMDDAALAGAARHGILGGIEKKKRARSALRARTVARPLFSVWLACRKAALLRPFKFWLPETDLNRQPSD